jgi:hypothetical protein
MRNTTMKSLLLAAALVMTASGAYAAETKPADATTKPAATSTASTASTASTKKVTKAERSAKSKACSAEADAKKLHGKARKAFRKTCMKAA